MVWLNAEGVFLSVRRLFWRDLERLFCVLISCVVLDPFHSMHAMDGRDRRDTALHL